MDRRSERFAQDVTSVLTSVLAPRLAGVYLHGSAVLGGFDARRSDVDMLAVLTGPVSAKRRAAVADTLSAAGLSCPARGLELTLVTIRVTQHPTAKPRFELHLATTAGDVRVVDGHRREGDPDLVLHFAVCRRAGRLVGPGRPVREVFAPVPDNLAQAQMLREIRWGAEHAPDEYAVLTACRAWKFTADQTLVSKIDAGRWALDRIGDADRDLVRLALARQRCEPAEEPDARVVAEFAARVLARISGSGASD
jgi:Domain of unknown function (DUF4111)